MFKFLPRIHLRTGGGGVPPGLAVVLIWLPPGEVTGREEEEEEVVGGRLEGVVRWVGVGSGVAVVGEGRGGLKGRSSSRREGKRAFLISLAP